MLRICLEYFLFVCFDILIIHENVECQLGLLNTKIALALFGRGKEFRGKRMKRNKINISLVLFCFHFSVIWFEYEVNSIPSTRTLDALFLPGLIPKALFYDSHFQNEKKNVIDKLGQAFSLIPGFKHAQLHFIHKLILIIKQQTCISTTRRIKLYVKHIKCVCVFFVLTSVSTSRKIICVYFSKLYGI